MENEFRKHQIIKARQDALDYVQSENMVGVNFCELVNNISSLHKEEARLYIIKSDLEKDAL